MKVLIIEDEGIAADRLEKTLREIDPSIEVLDKLDSVRSSLAWISQNSSPDLAFLDIQLADGKSFEILENEKATFPVIFTTAYDQYAINAFKVNAIDYLLKPIVKNDLREAIEKFRSRQSIPAIDTSMLVGLLDGQQKKYKERFVVKIRDHLKSIATQDIHLIYSQEKATYVLTRTGQKIIIDFTMDRVEEVLDPDIFFRISRKHLVHLDAIEDIIAFSNSRLKLKINGTDAEDIIVARERVSIFKEWLDR